MVQFRVPVIRLRRRTSVAVQQEDAETHKYRTVLTYSDQHARNAHVVIRLRRRLPPLTPLPSPSVIHEFNCSSMYVQRIARRTTMYRHVHNKQAVTYAPRLPSGIANCVLHVEKLKRTIYYNVPSPHVFTVFHFICRTHEAEHFTNSDRLFQTVSSFIPQEPGLE